MKTLIDNIAYNTFKLLQFLSLLEYIIFILKLFFGDFSSTRSLTIFIYLVDEFRILN